MTLARTFCFLLIMTFAASAFSQGAAKPAESANVPNVKEMRDKGAKFRLISEDEWAKLVAVTDPKFDPKGPVVSNERKELAKTMGEPLA